MKVILATDQDGFQLKETVKHYLLHSGYEVIDLNLHKVLRISLILLSMLLQSLENISKLVLFFLTSLDILLCLLISLKVLSAPLFPMNTLP